MNANDFNDYEVTDDDIKFLLRALAERLNARFGEGGWKIYQNRSTLIASGSGPAIVGDA